MDTVTIGMRKLKLSPGRADASLLAEWPPLRVYISRHLRIKKVDQSIIRMQRVVAKIKATRSSHAVSRNPATMQALGKTLRIVQISR